MAVLESIGRMEPARLDAVPGKIGDVVAELAAAAATLGRALHPTTASNLAALVRLMNTYYSNLIEGHNTRPWEIENALAGRLEDDEGRRNLQLEARAHVRVQLQIDLMAADGRLPEPASREFIRWLHREFYRDAPLEMLTVRGASREFVMQPGEWRSLPEHDNVVGQHVPPSSDRAADFMAHFEARYRFEDMGKAARIMAIAAAHHRFNYIHPFPDGNGRVSRLMSHAMGLRAGIGAFGLWSVSRGLARGLEDRSEYKMMMDHADMPRQGDLDGRGNLSERALVEFTAWFLSVCLDQVMFMSALFDIDNLMGRLGHYATNILLQRPESARLLEEAMIRGQFDRGDAPRITGTPVRTAQRMLNNLVEKGLLASATPKGPVSLRFPVDSLEILFPRLYAQA